MVHRTKIEMEKIEKRSRVAKGAKIDIRVYWGLALIACFFMILDRVWVSEARFLLLKHFFVKILINFGILEFLQLFGFRFCNFPILSFFRNYRF